MSESLTLIQLDDLETAVVNNDFCSRDLLLTAIRMARQYRGLGRPNDEDRCQALGSANYVVGWLEEAVSQGWMPALLLKRAEEVEAYLRLHATGESK